MPFFLNKRFMLDFCVPATETHANKEEEVEMENDKNDTKATTTKQEEQVDNDKTNTKATTTKEEEEEVEKRLRSG